MRESAARGRQNRHAKAAALRRTPPAVPACCGLINASLPLLDVVAPPLASARSRRAARVDELPRAKKNASAIGATHLGKAGRGNPRQRPEALRVRRVEQARDDVLWLCARGREMSTAAAVFPCSAMGPPSLLFSHRLRAHDRVGAVLQVCHADIMLSLRRVHDGAGQRERGEREPPGEHRR